MFIELVKGVALLLALCLLHGFNIRLWREHAVVGQVFSGLIFGTICVVGMLMPVVLVPGVIFDARSVVLSMAGLFGGPLVACIAASMAAAGRLYQGGAGAAVVLLVIVLCTALGLVYREGRARGRLGVEPVTLAMFGLLVHTAVLALFQLLPAAVAQRINDTLALPYLVTFTPATMVLGLLLRDVEQRLSTEHAYTDTTARLRAISQAIPDVLLVLDAEGRYVEVLSANEAPLAAHAPQLIGKRLHDVLPAAQADRFMALIRDTLRSGSTHSIEYEMQTLSGPCHFEGRAQPLGVAVNGQPAVVFLARDITQRRQAEDALRESELDTAQHPVHLGPGLSGGRHRHVLEPGRRATLRVHLRRSPGPQLAGAHHPPANARRLARGNGAHVRHRRAHRGGRAATAAQGRLASPRVLQPCLHPRARSAAGDVLHRHRHLGPQGRRGRGPLPGVL